MADEISIQATLSRKDSANAKSGTHKFEFLTTTFSQSAKRHNEKIQTIGTSEESFSVTDISTNGFLMMTNLDPTNYVEWGTTSGDYPGKMNAGEPALLRLNTGKTLYLKANTAACDVRICLYAD